jgi:hypothetical protein
MKRVLVIGVSGAGKSTLARRLSSSLNVPFFASDPFYWGSSWRLIPAEKVRQQVLDVVNRDAWALDGNFDDEHELVWKRANCIVWLDYSIITIFRRIVTRNLYWTITRQLVWSGNRMGPRRAVSGIQHALHSYALKRRTYPLWLAELSGTEVYRFQNANETEAWLQSLRQRIR